MMKDVYQWQNGSKDGAWEREKEKPEEMKEPWKWLLFQEMALIGIEEAVKTGGWCLGKLKLQQLSVKNNDSFGSCSQSCRPVIPKQGYTRP